MSTGCRRAWLLRHHGIESAGPSRANLAGQSGCAGEGRQPASFATGTAEPWHHRRHRDPGQQSCSQESERRHAGRIGLAQPAGDVRNAGGHHDVQARWSAATSARSIPAHSATCPTDQWASPSIRRSTAPFRPLAYDLDRRHGRRARTRIVARPHPAAHPEGRWAASQAGLCGVGAIPGVTRHGPRLSKAPALSPCDSWMDDLCADDDGFGPRRPTCRPCTTTSI